MRYPVDPSAGLSPSTVWVGGFLSLGVEVECVFLVTGL